MLQQRRHRSSRATPGSTVVKNYPADWNAEPPDVDLEEPNRLVIRNGQGIGWRGDLSLRSQEISSMSTVSELGIAGPGAASSRFNAAMLLAKRHIVVVTDHYGKCGAQKSFRDLVDNTIESPPNQAEADGG